MNYSLLPILAYSTTILLLGFISIMYNVLTGSQAHLYPITDKSYPITDKSMYKQVTLNRIQSCHKYYQRMLIAIHDGTRVSQTFTQMTIHCHSLVIANTKPTSTFHKINLQHSSLLETCSIHHHRSMNLYVY